MIEGRARGKQGEDHHQCEGCQDVDLKYNSVYADAKMIVQSIRYQMLQRQKDELEAADKEEMEAVSAQAWVSTMATWAQAGEEPAWPEMPACMEPAATVFMPSLEGGGGGRRGGPPRFVAQPPGAGGGGPPPPPGPPRVFW